MSNLRCRVCQRADVALFRQNPKGQPGIWACDKHHGRVECGVPYCRRSREAHWAAIWICGEHWRGVPRRLKQPYFRLRKLARAQGRWDAALWNRHQRLLRRFVQIATEAACGLR